MWGNSETENVYWNVLNFASPVEFFLILKRCVDFIFAVINVCDLSNDDKNKTCMPNSLFDVFFRLCDEFERISEKALTTPSNTQELMELKVLSSFLWVQARSSYQYKCSALK